MHSIVRHRIHSTVYHTLNYVLRHTPCKYSSTHFNFCTGETYDQILRNKSRHNVNVCEAWMRWWQLSELSATDEFEECNVMLEWPSYRVLQSPQFPCTQALCFSYSADKGQGERIPLQSALSRDPEHSLNMRSSAHIQHWRIFWSMRLADCILHWRFIIIIIRFVITASLHATCTETGIPVYRETFLKRKWSGSDNSYGPIQHRQI